MEQNTDIILMLNSIALPKYFTSYFGQINILLQMSTRVGINLSFLKSIRSP